MTDPTPFRF